MNHHIHIAYFGPDARDAAIKRRILSMRTAGFTVRAFTMRRQADMTHDWDNVDLGFVHHVAFLRRIGAILRALWILRKHRAYLTSADIWIARNLDLLVVAFFARKLFGGSAPLVYECLDIHRLMTRSDFVGRLMRWSEKCLLKGCSDLVVSSHGFLDEYFYPHYGRSLHATVIENRLPENSDFAPRPSPGENHSIPKRLTIGWYGVLRCKRSLNLMCAVATKLSDKAQVVLHGFTKPEDLPDFDSKISGLSSLSFYGRYAYPDDLPSIYKDVDLVWAGDYHDADFNSKWLLPNRLYEGGYFGVVPIAATDTETGRWIQENGGGFVIDEPIEKTLIEFLSTVTPEQIEEKRKKLLASHINLFVQPNTEIKDYILNFVTTKAPKSNKSR